MKDGKGTNHYLLNEATMIAILQGHLKYDTDQEVTSVKAKDQNGCVMFDVRLEEKKVKE